MEVVLIWDEGEKKGQVIDETKYLSEYLVNRDSFKIPLPPDIADFKFVFEGEESEPTEIKYAICKKSDLIIKDKVVCLCKEG